MQTPLDLPPEDATDAISLADFAERAYLDYAVSVVRGRALPDLCDGLKPVQRRILFAMDRLGLAANSKPVKSARVVGDVLGKFHPHGDQSAYDALVRLAQSFTVRYPLIDGQGNFGSRDGDGAAAMRYTEARLTPFAGLLLQELDEGTVEFGPNYDGSLQEPLRMPARLPICLLNGASGIAVGMATEIPPHNLREVAEAAIALIRNPELSWDELLQICPAPDFPGGGQITSPREEIAAAYQTGRGSLRVRARWSFEELARGQWQMVVHELAHGTSAQQILEQIEELTNPKIKAGKKSLSADQTQTKALVLGVLESVRDESGKDAAVRLVLEPRSRTIDRDEFVRVLLAQTSLETTTPINLVAVDASGRPRSLDLREMLSQWVGFRLDTVRRRSQHRLNQTLRRIHILEGRSAVLLRIDEVIRVIRESDEPKPALMSEFSLSELQAEDILEIRLRQLARLEALKIERELAELREKEQALSRLLGMEEVLRDAVCEEIAADARQFGDDRRTHLEAAVRTTLSRAVVDEPTTVIVSENGWLRSRQGHGHDPALLTFKTGDRLLATFECRTVDSLVALSSNGRAYSVAVSALPGGRGDGTPMTALIELEPGTRLLHFVAGDARTELLLATANGLGLRAPLESLVGRNRSGKAFLTVSEDDRPLMMRPLTALPAEQPDPHLAVLSELGRLLIFPLEELKQLPNGGKGVQLMDLTDEGDCLLDAQVISLRRPLRLTGLLKNGKPAQGQLEPRELAAYLGRRARKGRLLGLRFKPLLLADDAS